MPDPLDVYFSATSAWKYQLRVFSVVVGLLFTLYLKGERQGWPLWIYPVLLLLYVVLWGGQVLYHSRHTEPMLRIDEHGVTVLRKKTVVEWSHINNVWLTRWQGRGVKYNVMAFLLSEVRPYEALRGFGRGMIQKKLKADLYLELDLLDRTPGEIVARAQQWLDAMRPDLRNPNAVDNP